MTEAHKGALGFSLGAAERNTNPREQTQGFRLCERTALDTGLGRGLDLEGVHPGPMLVGRGRR